MSNPGHQGFQMPHGTGAGKDLAKCRKIVEQRRGAITEKNEKGIILVWPFVGL
jgi:hypothetical protein